MSLNLADTLNVYSFRACGLQMSGMGIIVCAPTADSTAVTWQGGGSGINVAKSAIINEQQETHVRSRDSQAIRTWEDLRKKVGTRRAGGEEREDICDHGMSRMPLRAKPLVS